MLVSSARPVIVGDNLSVIEESRFELPELDIQPTVWYDVIAPDAVVGNFGIEYDYGKRMAIINIGLADTALNKGYGIAIYSSVPNLPLPHGEDFRDMDFTLKSNHPSLRAQRLWRSLVRRDLAIECSDGTYQLL
jgi:hypothetical protein